MVPYKVVYITEDKLCVEKRWQKKVWHRWQMNLPKGIIRNGYCENAPYLKELLRTYGKRYGGWFLPVYLYCESTHWVRWQRQLPLMKPWERERILKHHQKELIPVQAEAYTLYYDVGSCTQGEQVIYLLGAPKVLEERYKAIFTRQLGVKVRYGCEMERRCEKSFDLLKKDCLVAYQQGDKVWMAISREGHGVVCCCSTLSVDEDVETQKEEVLMEIMKLLYFYSQHNLSERLKYLVLEDVVQKVPNDVEEKSITLASLKAEIEDEMGLQVIYLREVPRGKTRYMKRLNKRKAIRTSLKQLGISAALLVGVVIGVDGWQVIEKQQMLKHYEAQLAHPKYQEVQQQKEQKQALKMQVEKLKATREMIEGSSQFVVQTLGQMEKEPLLQEQHIRYYGIQAEGRQVVVEGQTASAAEFLRGVREMEKQWKDQRISCQFEEANLWQPTAFALYIAKKEKNSEMD